MRVLIDICHPAHVHFFRNPIALLNQRGHEIMVTSRVKEMATALLDRMGIEHRTLSSQSGGSAIGLCRELVVRNRRLHRLVREYRPDVMTAIGGIFVAHVGTLTRVPSLVFYDTETAHLQNALTYPLASRIYVPACYTGWVPKNRTRRYSGYHELSYLHPKYFQPNYSVAVRNGVAPEGETFLVRLVSWRANHDMGERGWSLEILRRVMSRLTPRGRVLISAEGDLPHEFAEHRYRGDTESIHHVMAFCRGFVGESATMASECAILGVPAIYAARTRLGYTNEQEARFNLVRNVRTLEEPAVDTALDWMMNCEASEHRRSLTRLLAETIDVAEFVADAIENGAERRS